MNQPPSTSTKNDNASTCDVQSHAGTFSVDELLTLLDEKSKIIHAQSTIINEKSIAAEESLAIIEKKSEVIEHQRRRIAALEEHLRLERVRRFGASSEKHAGQIAFVFNDVEVEDDIAPALHALEELKDQTDTASRKKRGRKGLSKNLPRHQVHLYLSDDEKAGAVETFFSVVKEELDVTPPKAQVIEYLQEKAVFIDEANQDSESDTRGNVKRKTETKTQSTRRVVAAKRPVHPLNKCIASIQLLTFIIIAKYTDGLSLYALENIIKRYGGNITRTAMANWVIRLSSE